MSKMGRPEKPVTIDDLKKLMQFKPTLRTCAGYFDVNETTIENRIKEHYPDYTFSEFRDKYMSNVRVSLVQKALKKALEDNSNTMLIFCLKNICQWSDNNAVDVTPGEGGIVNVTYKVN